MPAESDCASAQECQAVAELFATTLAENPCSFERPWHIIVGFDEFAPGNKLKVDNSRKCMNLSFTFREFGQAAWCTEVAWLTPVLRLRLHALLMGARRGCSSFR